MTTQDSLQKIARGMAVVVAVTIVAALHFGQDVLIPVVLAGLLCFVLSPLVDRLERWRFPRVGAVLLTTAFAFLILGAIAYIVAGQLLDLAYKLPSYKENMRAKIVSLQVPNEGPVGNLARTFDELRAEFVKRDGPAERSAESALEGAPKAPALSVEVVNESRFTEMIQRAAAPVAGPIGTAAVVIVFVVFMLLRKEDLRNRVIHLAGRSRLSLTTLALEEAGTRVSRYLLMQVIVNVTYAIPIGVGLLLIGVPNALLWAVLTAMLRFVPYIGPWIGASFPIALSLAVTNSWTMPLLTIALFVVVELVSNNVMEPWLYGSSTGLSPVAILIAAVFWTWLWGTVGLLLSTPLTVCLAVLGRHVPALRFLDVLLANESSLPAPDRYYQRLLARDETEAQRIIVEYSEHADFDHVLAEVLASAVLAAEADLECNRLEHSAYSALLAIVRKHALRGEPAPADASADLPPPDVFIIPAEDEGDEVLGILLGEMLGAKVHTQVISHQMLTNEKAAAALASGSPVLCISDTSRHDAPRARFLGRRLRQRECTAFVFTGLWSFEDGGSNLVALAEKFAADQVATNLVAARDALRSWVVQPSVVAGAPGPAATRATAPSV